MVVVKNNEVCQLMRNGFKDVIVELDHSLK